MSLSTTDRAGVTRRNGSGRGASRLMLGAGDRSKSFRQARRHSSLVRALRIGLPLASLGMSGAYVMAVLGSAGWMAPPPARPAAPIVPELLTMDNPHYKGFNKDGGSYEVGAERARQDLNRDGVIALQTITGLFHEKDKTTTTLKAVSGEFDSKANMLELFERIDVSATSGLKARLSRASVDIKDGLVRSSEPVTVALPSGTVTANGMTLHQKIRAVTFVDNVHAHLSQPAPSLSAPPQPAPPAQPATASAPAPLLWASSGPIDVTAQRLDIDDLGHTAVFMTGVRALQADAVLETPELHISYEPKAPETAGAPAAAGGIATDAQGSSVRHIQARGPVRMTRANGDEALADALEHVAATKVTHLIGTVILSKLPDRHLSGDWAELDGRTDTMLMTGAVHLVQGRNELHGRRLTLDQRSGKSRLTVPAEGATPAGRITARFFQGDGKTPAPPVKAKPIPAPGDATPAFKTDPTQPIDIDADTLDVDDHAKTAVFRGAVKASQGDFIVHGAELTARYSGAGGLASAAVTTPPAPGQGQGGTQLTRIEVRRNVVITSALGRTATGDSADFDVKSNKAVLTGNVRLTQDKNVVNGTRLTMDLANGETVIDTAPAATAARPGGGPAGLPGGRPSMTVFPGQHGIGAAPAAPGAPADPARRTTGPAASSWEVHANPPGR